MDRSPEAQKSPEKFRVPYERLRSAYEGLRGTFSDFFGLFPDFSNGFVGLPRRDILPKKSGAALTL